MVLAPPGRYGRGENKMCDEPHWLKGLRPLRSERRKERTAFNLDVSLDTARRSQSKPSFERHSPSWRAARSACGPRRRAGSASSPASDGAGEAPLDQPRAEALAVRRDDGRAVRLAPFQDQRRRPGHARPAHHQPDVDGLVRQREVVAVVVVDRSTFRTRSLIAKRWSPTASSTPSCCSR